MSRRFNLRRAALIGTALALGLCACRPTEEALAPGNETAIPADGAAMVHAEGTTIVDPSGRPLPLRCVNVDGWLMPVGYLVSDAGNALFVSPSEFHGRLDEVVGAERAESFWRDWRDAFITEADFERMAALGLNCARLVLYHRAITNEERTAAGDVRFVLDEDVMRYVDAATRWGRAHGVYVVLDLHSAPGGQNGLATVSDVPASDPDARLWVGPDAEANQEATVAIWRALAERYRGDVTVAGYDLLNEPALPDGVPERALPDLYARIIEAIREVDPDHMLFIEGDELAHDFSMFDAPLDANMVYELHAYALTGFEDWASPETSDLRPYLELRERDHRPLWLGEFGENDQDWQLAMISLMEEHDIGWALYPWKRKQTWFFNPVLQQIPAAPRWYSLASYLARPVGDETPAPSPEEAEAAMAEVLDAVSLPRCREDGTLANAMHAATRERGERR